MSNDLNLCQFIGRLGRKPEQKFTASGSEVSKFSIAVGESYTKDGQKVEKTEWVNVGAFGKLAEICNRWLDKGSQVYVSGKLNTSEYTTKEGQKKYFTNIVARDIQMLGAPQKQEKDQKSNVHSEAMMDTQKPDDIPF